MRTLTTKKVVLISLLVALALLPTAMIHLPTGLFRLGGLPLILSGYLMGPWVGGFIGGIVDIMGFLVKPPGPFHIGFTVTSILTAMIPAFFMKYLRPTYWNFVVTIGLGQLITSVLMVGYIQHTLYGLPLVYYWSKSLFSQTVHVFLYALVAKGVAKSIQDLPGTDKLLAPSWKS